VAGRPAQHVETPGQGVLRRVLGLRHHGLDEFRVLAEADMAIERDDVVGGEDVLGAEDLDHRPDRVVKGLELVDR